MGGLVILVAMVQVRLNKYIYLVNGLSCFVV